MQKNVYTDSRVVCGSFFVFCFPSLLWKLVFIVSLFFCFESLVGARSPVKAATRWTMPTLLEEAGVHWPHG